MISLMCYCCPAILAIWMTECIRKENYVIKEWIYYFCLYMVSIHFVILLMLTKVFKHPDALLNTNQFTNLFSLKYLIISLVLVIILPILFTIIKENFHFEMVIETFNDQRVRSNQRGKKRSKKRTSKSKK